MDDVRLEGLEDQAGTGRYEQESSSKQHQCTPERVVWK
jgi:hypothetical protein